MPPRPLPVRTPAAVYRSGTTTKHGSDTVNEDRQKFRYVDAFFEGKGSRGDDSPWAEERAEIKQATKAKAKAKAKDGAVQRGKDAFLQPLLPNARSFKGAPDKPCAVIVDEQEFDTDLPLIPEKRTALRTHAMRLKLSYNSQLPGIYLSTHTEQGVAQGQAVDSPAYGWREWMEVAPWCFMISPDQCNAFNVSLATEEQADDMKKILNFGKGSVELRSEEGKTSCPGILRIDVVMKDGEHPVPKFRGHRSDTKAEALPVVNAMARCSRLEILAAYQGEIILKQLKWFQTVLEQCQQNPLAMKTLWSYGKDLARRRSLAASTLPELLCEAYTEKAWPKLPDYLISERGELHDMHSGSQKPVIATKLQWATTQLIGVLREGQCISGQYVAINKGQHQIRVRLQERIGAKRVFLCGITFSKAINDNLLPAQGTSVDFRYMTPLPSNDFSLSQTEAYEIMLNGEVVTGKEDMEGDLFLRLDLRNDMGKDVSDGLAKLEQAVEVHKGHGTATVHLTASHAHVRRQTNALRDFADAPLRPKAFDLGRFIIGQPENEFELNFEQQFDGQATWRNGDHISDEQRSEISSVIKQMERKANPEQGMVISKSLRSNVNGYLEVTGPPGTGKTWTMAGVAAILALLGKRVIVTAQSNQSVNELLSKTESHLQDAKKQGSTKLVRIVRVHHATAEDGHRSSLISTDSSKQHATHQTMAFPQYSLSLLTIELARSKRVEDHTDDRLRSYAYDLGSKTKSKILGMDSALCSSVVESAEDACLETMDMIFTTADTLTNLMRRPAVRSEIMIVDELSLSTTSQFVQVVSKNDACEAVYSSGDPSQVNPKPQSRKAKVSEFGTTYGLSAMKALYLHPDQRVMVKKNYRISAETVNLLTEMGLYKGLEASRDDRETSKTIQYLEASKDRQDFLEQTLQHTNLKETPIVFFSIPEKGEVQVFEPSKEGLHVGYESSLNGESVIMQAPRSTKRWHPQGQSVCVDHIAFDLVKAGIAPKDIALLSSFRPDTDGMRQKLNLEAPTKKWSESVVVEAREAFREIDVATVTQFQGREKDVIIWNLASADRDAVSYSASAERLCVALTSARYLLCIVGEWERLQWVTNEKRSGTHYLCQLLDWIKRHNAVVYLPSVNPPGNSKRKRVPYEDLDSPSLNGHENANGHGYHTGGHGGYEGGYRSGHDDHGSGYEMYGGRRDGYGSKRPFGRDRSPGLDY